MIHEWWNVSRLFVNKLGVRPTIIAQARWSHRLSAFTQAVICIRLFAFVCSVWHFLLSHKAAAIIWEWKGPPGMPGQAGPGRAGPRLPGPLRATRVLSQRLTGSHPLMMEGIVHSCFCVSQGVIVVYLTISSGGGQDTETNISIINSDYLMFLFLITFFNFLQFMKLTTLFKIKYSVFSQHLLHFLCYIFAWVVFLYYPECFQWRSNQRNP